MGQRQRPVTVITGGSRGIGAATATRLARAAHDVALGYRSDRDSAERAAEAVREQGSRCVTVRADVTVDSDVERLFDAARAGLGPVTGLVNNAGVTGSATRLADASTEVIRQVVDINLVGSLLCARRAIQEMQRGDVDGGESGLAIVNVSSGAATRGSPNEWVHYAAAKAGVESLTVGLAKELAPQGVRVNAVAPGLVHTDIHAAAGDPGRPARLAEHVPLGRAGEPSEIAGAIAWLLSPEASYTTGAVLRVAGGR